MKIYVASSWRCILQPGVVHILRTAGHEVYDFRNPPNKTGFAWSEIDPDWLKWTPEKFVDRLYDRRAINGFNEDFAAMRWADACVLVLPCGRSAHLEAGYFWGAGKPLYILLSDDKFEPELMYKGATGIHTDMVAVVDALGKAVPRGD